MGNLWMDLMEEIFKVNKDLRRVKNLFEMAKERIVTIIPILPKETSYKFLEEYYEVLVQLITAIMYSDGYKTLSHVSLIEYLSKNYKNFNAHEIDIINILRKFRHGTIYYGKREGAEFLENNKYLINTIINKLFTIVKSKIDIEIYHVFIIHGTMGNPKENWFPWISKELQKLECKIFVPKFPTPENQNLENWIETFKKYEAEINETTIFIGHSLGAAFILNLLERINKPVKAAFLVSGFIGPLNKKEFDNINQTFTNREFNWKKIKANCKRFYVINSDNDPYVPLNKGKELAKFLETNLIIIKEAGHINKESGYEKFDFLLDKIKEEIISNII